MAQMLGPRGSMAQMLRPRGSVAQMLGPRCSMTQMLGPRGSMTQMLGPRSSMTQMLGSRGSMTQVLRSRGVGMGGSRVARHAVTGNASENFKEIMILLMMEFVVGMLFIGVGLLDMYGDGRVEYLGDAPGSGSPIPGLGPAPGGKVGPTAGPVWYRVPMRRKIGEESNWYYEAAEKNIKWIIMGPVVGCWPPGAPGTREPAGRAKERVDVKSRDFFSH